MNDLLTTSEALKVLNLKNRHVIGWLVKRDLLPRIALGPRTNRYRRSDCERLIQLAISGVILTRKP